MATPLTSEQIVRRLTPKKHEFSAYGGAGSKWYAHQMATNKNQHFVPRCYFRRLFATGRQAFPVSDNLITHSRLFVRIPLCRFPLTCTFSAGRLSKTSWHVSFEKSWGKHCRCSRKGSTVAGMQRFTELGHLEIDRNPTWEAFAYNVSTRANHLRTCQSQQ